MAEAICSTLNPFSPQIVAALITGIVALFACLATLFFSWRTNRNSVKVQKEIADMQRELSQANTNLQSLDNLRNECLHISLKDE